MTSPFLGGPETPPPPPCHPLSPFRGTPPPPPVTFIHCHHHRAPPLRRHHHLSQQHSSHVTYFFNKSWHNLWTTPKYTCKLFNSHVIYVIGLVWSPILLFINDVTFCRYPPSPLSSFGHLLEVTPLPPFLWRHLWTAPYMSHVYVEPWDMLPHRSGSLLPPTSNNPIKWVLF